MCSSPEAAEVVMDDDDSREPSKCRRRPKRASLACHVCHESGHLTSSHLPHLNWKARERRCGHALMMFTATFLCGVIHFTCTFSSCCTGGRVNEGPEAGAGFMFVLVCRKTRNLLRTAVGSPSAASAEMGLSRDCRAEAVAQASG